MDHPTRFDPPTPVGSGALPAALLGAVMTVGLVAAVERADWTAVARRVHRAYARAYDTLTTAHRGLRCAVGTAVAAACVAGSWMVVHQPIAGPVGVASGLVVLALVCLVVPGGDHPRYADRRARPISLVPPGQPGHGWMFADETTLIWPGGVRPSEAARARRLALGRSTPLRSALLADED
jgi:hypothetical protein